MDSRVHAESLGVNLDFFTFVHILDASKTWKSRFYLTPILLDEVHSAKLRNKESETSLDQIFTEIGFAWNKCMKKIRKNVLYSFYSFIDQLYEEKLRIKQLAEQIDTELK